MVFKYNLTTAVQESNIIVHDKSWVQSLKNAEEDESLIRQEISKALNPITEEMMKVPAEEFVQTIPMTSSIGFQTPLLRSPKLKVLRLRMKSSKVTSLFVSQKSNLFLLG